MSLKSKTLFTIGEFAKMAGVTLRTLRYYDKIGLLKPSLYNNIGHRLYSKEDFGKLQKILTLKFIGLSLNDISNIMKYDMNQKDLKNSLEIQKDIMENKIDHIQTIIHAITEAINMLNNSNTLDWNKFIKIMNLINTDKKWMQQYKNASNLRARIRIHELYSTNKEGWMNWFFDQLNLSDNISILELGCGDASLWCKNYSKISENWSITLTDFSSGMLEDAKKNLGKRKNRFKFKIVDAQNITFDNASFDVVIANNMLYHVNHIEKAFSEIKRVLKDGGYFFASTAGENHMKEMREIVSKFNWDNLTTQSWNLTKNFQLENGLDMVSKWFKKVKLKRYKDNLFVTDAMPLIDYIFSMPGNTKKFFTEKDIIELKKSLQKKIKTSGGIYITKDTGFFQGRK
ncbi:methyltransferase domain-containing protein [Clostridium fermenticellae]|uniref:Methyltransferase domain-containing protein n=1 Tax=Clostridium fermenticellae TaxID=2068654 RepID=A0A386H4N4_9CLOT|nr:MerR family transcriptional regulator [Clostridium fermenticellae]AYD40455.1 methyltransferase domain-containing protein [Clostridium fermenticellae]